MGAEVAIGKRSGGRGKGRSRVNSERRLQSMLERARCVANVSWKCDGDCGYERALICQVDKSKSNVVWMYRIVRSTAGNNNGVDKKAVKTVAFMPM